jgi:hypothetical protein
LFSHRFPATVPTSEPDKEKPMASLVLMVLTNPAEGREDEYNAWYTDEHLDDVLACEGFRAAQRFQFAPGQLSPDAPFKYLAIYEAEEGSIERAEKALLEAAGTDAMPISRAMQRERATWWFTAITDRVEVVEKL